MKFSGENGLIKAPARRFVVGMLLIGWLQIAAQPCLMAMEMTPDAFVASEHTVHTEDGEHVAHGGDAPDCGHCPPVAHDQANQCASGAASDCEIFPGYNLDGRHFDKQSKDVSPQFTLIALAKKVDHSGIIESLLHDIKRRKFAGDPPLNLRHCKFLK